MWVCIKCNAENDDQYTVCSQCGASRSAGRFGTNAANTRNAAAYAAPLRQNMQPSGQPAVAAERAAVPMLQQTPQVQYVPDFSHVHAGRGYLYFGALLAVLLPATLLLLAVCRYDVWSQRLLALIFKEVETVSKPVCMLVYGYAALLGALIASLPGLWTLAVGKALRRLGRMEELL